MNKVYLLFIFIVALSCKKNAELNYSNSNINKDYIESVELIEVDKITLPLDNTAAFSHDSYGFNKSSNDSSYYYSFLNMFEKSIVYYNLNDKKINKVLINIEGPNGVGDLSDISSHVMESTNSFYLYNENSGFLFNLDSLGTIKNKYSILDYKSNSNYSVPDSAGGVNPFFIHNDVVYFPCFPGRDSSPNQKGEGMILKYNLITKTSNTIAPLPQIYNEGFWGSYHKYLTYISFNVEKQKLVLSHPISQQIFTSDLNGNITDSIYAVSSFFEPSPPMTTDESYRYKENRNWKKEEDYSFSTSDYYTIAYDSINDYYYRFSFVRPTLSEVKRNLGIPNFSIIILDKNFKKIGEQLFSSKIYHNSMIAVTDMGILIARQDLYKKNENEITFSVFNPSKIKN